MQFPVPPSPSTCNADFVCKSPYRYPAGRSGDKCEHGGSDDGGGCGWVCWVLGLVVIAVAMVAAVTATRHRKAARPLATSVTLLGEARDGAGSQRAVTVV